MSVGTGRTGSAPPGGLREGPPVLLTEGPRVLAVTFLVFPFLFLFFQFGAVRSVDVDEILWAAGNTFVQAFFSATFSLLLGLWGAAGLLGFSSDLRRYWRSLLEMLLLIPNFLPAIFTLLAALNLVDPFPMGKIGVILVHTLLNWGLVAVLLAGLIEQKAGGVAELAWLEGCGRLRFLARGLLPMLAKDLALLWVFVFSICFGGFAVPLVVGGGSGTTLEVLIYERIRLSTDWSQAVVIAALQSVLLFGLAWLAASGRSAAKSRPANLRLFTTWSGLIPIAAMTFFLGFGYVQGLPSGFAQAGIFVELAGDLWRAFLGSLWVGLSVGGGCFALLLAFAALIPSRWFERFMAGFTPPSQALTAFAFLVAVPNDWVGPLWKIPVALILLTMPTLWRMGWQADLDGLRRQREVADTLGAGPRDFILTILIPQLAPRAGTLSGLAAVWACGDFAVSRILAHRDLTLAMMTETLMGSYRLGLATLLSSAVFASGVLCFAAMKGAGRVLGRKPFA